MNYVNIIMDKIIVDTHYINNVSVQVQNFVSGQVCCMNQYNYESWVSDVVSSCDIPDLIQSLEPTVNTLCISNISIKKQILNK